MTYSGTLITGLFDSVAARDPLRWYELRNHENGRVCPPEREILESEAQWENSIMAGAGSDWRWCVIPERGSR